MERLTERYVTTDNEVWVHQHDCIGASERLARNAIYTMDTQYGIRRTDMQELEKILDEIDETIERYGKNPYIDEKVTDLCYGLNIAKDIIRKHMNDGWIPVEKQIPEENGDDGELIVTDKNGRVWSRIYYGFAEETDEEPCFHKWDDEMWQCYKPDVIAWRPLPEPYRERSKGE